MTDTIKPSILLSGFVSNFNENGQNIYLITYNSNGKKVSNVKDTFDLISMVKAIELNTNIDGNLGHYGYWHTIKSKKIESMEQLENLKNNFKVLIFSLVDNKSELYFCNLDGAKQINVANYYGTCYYTKYCYPSGKIEYLSIDDYENTILNK